MYVIIEADKDADVKFDTKEECHVTLMNLDDLSRKSVLLNEIYKDNNVGGVYYNGTSLKFKMFMPMLCELYHYINCEDETYLNDIDEFLDCELPVYCNNLDFCFQSTAIIILTYLEVKPDLFLNGDIIDFVHLDGSDLTGIFCRNRIKFHWEISDYGEFLKKYSKYCMLFT